MLQAHRNTHNRANTILLGRFRRRWCSPGGLRRRGGDSLQSKLKLKVLSLHKRTGGRTLAGGVGRGAAGVGGTIGGETPSSHDGVVDLIDWNAGAGAGVERKVGCSSLAGV
jgi:hypothetical protein